MTTETATKPAPAKPAPKPAAKSPAKGKAAESRRWFIFTAAGAAWATFTAAMTMWTLGAVRFMYPNVLTEPPAQFDVGPADQFETGVVYENWRDEFQVWIISLPEERHLIALSTVCTHLGCTPNWLEGEQKFKCPCHGSGFYKSGINFEGPAPRPLERFRIYRIGPIVAVDKSKKFQYELGQWSDPQSFLEV